MSKFAKCINSKNAKAITKKKRNIYIFLFSPGNLLITPYQLSNFGAPSCNGLEISSFLCSFLCKKNAKGNS